ncbi:HIR complex subunit [Coemansia thaxteri]|nr:HIR complex subunit [Coemansia thaxteri]
MDVEESRRMGHGDPSPPNPPAAKSTTTKPPPGTLVERVAVDAPIWIEARVLGTRLDAGPPAAETDSTDESTGGGGVRIAGSVGLAQELGRQTLVHAQSISAARVHLSVPRVAAHVTSDGRGAAHVTLSAFNTAGSARLVCTPNSAVAGDKGGWTKHVARRILLVAASGAVAAASCEDGTLHVFDGATGARLLPPIVCEAHLAALRCAQRFCVALDCVGQLSVWDCGDRPRVVVDRVSVAPLLYSAELPVISSSNGEDAPGEGVVAAPGRQAPAVALTAVDVAGDQGAPVVCLSDGRAFAYDLAVRAWLCIGDPLAYAGSDFAGSTSSSLAATTATAAVFTPTSRTPLGRIQETGSHQRRLTSTTNKTTATPAPSLPSDVRMLVTLDHIEHQVGAAAAIGSRDDVVRWTDILARHLARAGDAARTEFWLRSLLGPPLIHGLLPTTMPGQPTQWEEWVPALAGVPRRQLLGRMLPILAGNRRLQAVVTEYSAALARLAPEAT